MEVDLTCVSRAAAAACTDYLVACGVTSAVQYGTHVHVSLTNRSVRRLVTTAVERRWVDRDSFDPDPGQVTT